MSIEDKDIEDAWRLLTKELPEGMRVCDRVHGMRRDVRWGERCFAKGVAIDERGLTFKAAHQPEPAAHSVLIQLGVPYARRRISGEVRNLPATTRAELLRAVLAFVAW